MVACCIDEINIFLPVEHLQATLTNRLPVFIGFNFIASKAILVWGD